MADKPTTTESDSAGTNAAERRPARSAFAGARNNRRLQVVPDVDRVDSGPVSTSTATTGSGNGLGLGLVDALVGMMRAAGGVAGLSGEDLDRRITQALAFLRRRLTGDYDIDNFGFDQEFTEQVWLPLLRPIYQRWFRVEVRGIENLPLEGGALVVANHSGTVPIDGLMAQVAIHDETPGHRHARALGADLVFQSPGIGTLARKTGSTLAAHSDAERLLRAGELVFVCPEGFKGVGKPFSERYRLQRFGRGGFVSAALRTGVPIIPCSIVGAEEIYPLIGNAKGLARFFGFPYFPITATFPWLGPLGLVPLPSKWIIEFGAPIHTEGFDPVEADDPSLVFELTDQVRETIQQTLYSLLLQRRSVFW
ncbi:MAG: lysophospholipid acyltransferase family protein [Allobranchiibius sp.]|nr:acyltransferase family protein [Actinomycetota bacterium]